MSDTHGNRVLMHRIADGMVAAGAEIIYHLGDDYEDAEELRMAGHHVIVVPGLWCEAYRSNRAPKTSIEHFGWLTVACAHSPDDLRGPERRASLIMHGHTHRAMLEQRRGAVWLNPGHLKRPYDRGQDASYAMVSREENALSCRIHELDGTIRVEQRFDRSNLNQESRAS